jgi:hypothetical protein
LSNDNLNSFEKEKKDLAEQNMKSLKHINSCTIFNNDKLKNDLDMNQNNNNNNTELEKVIIKNKTLKRNKSNKNMSLNSKKYMEKLKLKFDKCKYYNAKNSEYINERRQRIEEKLNEIINEKYKITRPLRMTERVFYVKDESKNDNINNKITFDNHMCKILNNKSIINNYDFNMYFYLNNFKENADKQNGEKCNQMNYYNNQINNIIKMRKYMSTESFFNDFKRDYNLLDFNFAFLLENFKK